MAQAQLTAPDSENIFQTLSIPHILISKIAARV